MLEVTVTEITIQLADGSTVAMSVNDAKALHRSLNELFGKASISSTPTVIVKETWPKW